MNINYCLPIIKKKKGEVLDAIRDTMDEYQYFEVWLDYVEDLDDAFVTQLIEQLGGRLILLFRRQNLEKIHMSFEKRCAFLSMLDKKPVLVDLDMYKQKEELSYMREKGLSLQLILSYHNYKLTPDKDTLAQIVAEMGQLKPRIYKISAYCQVYEDALRLLELLHDLQNKKLRFIVLGMGEAGEVTRIYGTLWGNEMIFAPKAGKEQSAPGQLTKDKLEAVFKELRS